MIGALTKALADDVFALNSAPKSVALHQMAAIKWLKKAHDSTPDDGVGYGYYMRGKPFSRFGMGWRGSYVETSGYTIETFYDVARAYNDPGARKRAEKIGRWLVQVQNKDGSFSNPNIGGAKGLVFDTGQVLFGLLRCYRETGEMAFRSAAARAANWLSACVSVDGGWYQNTHRGIPHSYNARVAWAMLEYCRLIPNPGIECAARRNLEWVVRRQSKNGLFADCSFDTKRAPFTHTIAYTIRGLYESSILLDNYAMKYASYKAALSVLKYVDEDGSLPGRIDISGNTDDSFTCLAGNCQLAIIWYKMGVNYGDIAMVSKAHRVLEHVLKFHNIETNNKNINGALKGSHPIWGQYTPLAYPNWATKFLIDALLLKSEMEAP